MRLTEKSVVYLFIIELMRRGIMKKKKEGNSFAWPIAVI
jgi:hypothetical protein